MSNGPDLLEFEHLQDLYRRTCEAFERGELTSSKARDIIVGLRHTDPDGVEWKVDTTRSGRRAAFIRVDGKPTTASASKSDTTRPPTARVIQTGFDKLDDKYREICEAFDRGELSSTAARNEVLALRFTDAHGRTWKIDTHRSGKRAAFVQDHDTPAAPPPTSRPTQPVARVATPTRDDHAEPAPSRSTRQQTPPTSADDYEYARRSDHERGTSTDDEPLPRQLRVKEMAFAATSLIAGLALLMGWMGDDGSATTASSNPQVTTPSNTQATTPSNTQVTTPVPTIPTDTNVTYPKLSTFGNRAAVPISTEIEFGRSVMNRPLTVIRRGNPNGIRVMVVGCIHGTEFAGLAVTDILKTMTLPSNIDLWILPMLNPDGYALKTRQNANKVDLNRNFPVNWRPIGELGSWQWSGTDPATEPEVQAMMNLGNLVQPQLTIWYHQDYFRISPGAGRDGAIRKRYAKLVDLPILKIEGGSYSGTASMWSETMNKNDTTSLTVEFGKGLRNGEAQANAAAITTVVNEFFPT